MDFAFAKIRYDFSSLQRFLSLEFGRVYLVTNVKRIAKVRLDDVSHGAFEAVRVGGHVRTVLQNVLRRHFALRYILHIKLQVSVEKNNVRYAKTTRCEKIKSDERMCVHVDCIQV